MYMYIAFRGWLSWQITWNLLHCSNRKVLSAPAEVHKPSLAVITKAKIGTACQQMANENQDHLSNPRTYSESIHDNALERVAFYPQFQINEGTTKIDGILYL